MIVLDASALVAMLLRTPAGYRIEERVFRDGESVHAPHLLDLEVANALRKTEARGLATAVQADAAIHAHLQHHIRRYPHTPFLQRVWALRHNLSAYDAAYVALAEALDAPLVTRDGRIAAAPGHTARVEVF